MAGPHDDGDWDPSTSAHRRMLRIHANDGLIAAAGIIQGLNSAGATGAEAMVAALATMIVGGLLVFGAEFGEAAAERDSQLAIVEAERLRLEMSPQEEFAELVAIYRRKGLTERVAHDVARELSEKDALAAQLDAEYGIAELGALARPLRVGLWCAAAFVVGSAIPLPFLTIVPVLTREIALVVIVAVALTASAVIGAKSDRTNAFAAVARTLGIGLGTMAVSLFAGSLVSF